MVSNYSKLTFSVAYLLEQFGLYGKPSRHRYVSADGRFVYNLAIIDYLQGYDFEKWGEHQIKVWIYLRDGSKISACHPNPYARRFLHFMREFVIINQMSTKQRTTSFTESFLYESSDKKNYAGK